MYEVKEPYNIRLLIVILLIIITVSFVARNKIGAHISNAFDFTYAKAYNLDTVKVDIIKPEEISYIVIDTIDDTVDNTIDTINKLVITTVKPATVKPTTNSTHVKKLVVDTTSLLITPEEEIVVEKVKEKEVKIQAVDSVKSTTKTEPTKKKKSIFNIFKRGV